MLRIEPIPSVVRLQCSESSRFGLCKKNMVQIKFNVACHYFLEIAENVFWLLVVLIFSSVAKASPGEVRLFSTEWNKFLEKFYLTPVPSPRGEGCNKSLNHKTLSGVRPLSFSFKHQKKSAALLQRTFNFYISSTISL